MVSQVKMPLGKVMLGVAGFELTLEEKEMLLHPLVAGVILFTRNYQNPEQLTDLTQSIKDLRTPELLIGVDHEGGRVQRFREGFTAIEPMGKLGDLYLTNPNLALQKAQEVGQTIAQELTQVGGSFSFTPVLDLDYGKNQVVGDRSFSKDPEVVTALARALRKGLSSKNMAAVAKHFPGHGFVDFDTHTAIAIDNRSFTEIEAQDLIPFKNLIADGIEGVMPAHIIYSEVDEMPAGFSKVWLKDILRGQLGFKGVIVSDDMGMQASKVYGSLLDRVELAINAGCDLVLPCNELDEFAELLDGWKQDYFDAEAQERLLKLS